MYRLRKKIEAVPARPTLIQNVPEVGYRFVTEATGRTVRWDLRGSPNRHGSFLESPVQPLFAA
jgi:DNA-binding winged helix-turn-helix (wHTH) protein